MLYCMIYSLPSISSCVLIRKAAFVQEQCPPDVIGIALEMRAGFPPKDISPLYGDTIELAKLAGDSIQCRYT